MHIKDLDFTYPDELVALEPQRPSRVMLVHGENPPAEITVDQLIDLIPKGDVLVVNNTKVLRRRVFVPFKKNFLEILFLTEKEPYLWDVLFPAKDLKIGGKLQLPDGVTAELIEKGRPQLIRVDRSLDEEYFFKHGELPLPPYIQKLRSSRNAIPQDEKWYQTAWSEKPGSLASPTASLHFTTQHMDQLRNKGVHILPVTLHVGLGTFLPVTTENLDDFTMHEEFVEVSESTWAQIQKAKTCGNKVWTMGTTATRAVESVGQGLLPLKNGTYRGKTRIFIKPGYVWKVTDRLLTNFHQPESTLLALVAAFSSLEKVKACYAWAILRKYRLFSYGDLSVWIP